MLSKYSVYSFTCRISQFVRHTRQFLNARSTYRIHDLYCVTLTPWANYIADASATEKWELSPRPMLIHQKLKA